MSLFAQIDDQLKAAMRAKDTSTLNTLRMLKSAIKYEAIQKHGADGQATDDEIIAVIRREIKKREDSIAAFTQAGRADQAAAESTEIDLLKTFLPAALTEEELDAIVTAAIAEVGATSRAQMGAVMKLASAKAAGRTDGKTLSALVQKKLGG